MRLIAEDEKAIEVALNILSEHFDTITIALQRVSGDEQLSVDVGRGNIFARQIHANIVAAKLTNQVTSYANILIGQKDEPYKG